LVSPYAYVVPVVAYLVGVIALGEPFHPAILLSAAAIVAAVAAEIRAAPESSPD
jgi:drug/metabolite transporter (DMT)-like permease